MERIPQMVSMEMDEQDVEASFPSAAVPSAPRYPYGLSICFCERELDRLKVDYDDWEVGDLFHLFCMAKITSIKKEETQDGMNCRVEMQIVAIGAESEDKENQEAEEIGFRGSLAG